MKRIHKREQDIRQENLGDTLEFLSLDDETIEAYSRNASSYAGDYDDMDDDYDDIEADMDDDYDDIDDDYDNMDDSYDDIDDDLDDISDEIYGDADVSGYGGAGRKGHYAADLGKGKRYYEEDYDEGEEYFEEDYNADEYCEDDDIEDYSDSDEYYEDDEYIEDGCEDNRSHKRGFIAFVAHMSSIDRVVAIFGFFIIIIAAVTGTLYVNAKTTSKQVEAFAEIGADIEGIALIGESGLIAVSDAESARLSQMMAQEPPVEEVEEEDKTIEVGMNITSIQSDIKIKFVNKETNKLIAGVPFEVEVTGSKSKLFVLKDDDKDGIIYQTGVDADTYTVKAAALKGEEYADYKFSSQSETIKVTDTIAYKKVDVAAEIKSESEVNAAAEDTAKQTETESTLTDTVEWVESTRTEIESDENYKEIKKSDIPDPSSVSRAAVFMKFSEAPSGSETQTQTPDTGNDANEGGGFGEGENGGGEGGNTGEGSGGNNDNSTGDNGDNSGNNGDNAGDSTPKTDKEKLEALKPSLTPTTASIKKGESISLIFSTQKNGSYILDWSSSNTSVAIVDDNGGVTGAAAGTADILATLRVDSSSSDSLTFKCSVTVTDDSASTPTVTYKMKSVTGGGNIKVGKTCTVSGTTEPEGGKVTWSSSNPKIASVDDKGVVTGVSTGTVSIIGTSESGDSKECSVTVEAADVVYKSVKITGASTIQVGKTAVLKAVTNPEGGSVLWESDNEKVVKIDDDGKMTGVSVGSATITAECGDAQGTLKVTVTKEKDVSGDTKTKLKDKKGNQIYVKNSDGKYVEATYADYFKSNKFYLKSDNVKYRYTGWQTIDGYTYFFDKNGNYVTGEQVIQGAKYNFGSDGRLSSSSGTLGIDVSKWNGSIDWNAVRNSGVSYVIIRCGYRGSSTGALIEDPKFVSNIKGAKAAGLKVGVYFFTQAVNEVEAVEEASMAINLVRGYGLNYPIFLDVEASGGRADSISAATRTAICRAFCATVQNSGYSAGIYANKTWLTSYINTGSLTGYKIWLAQYASAPSYTATRYDMWQYSSKGKVSGISGNVDMNISYMNY